MLESHKHTSCDARTLAEMLHKLKHQVEYQQSQQYAYDKQFSEYIQAELHRIKNKINCIDTDNKEVVTVSEKLNKLREQISTGEAIPVISKFKINQLFN